MFEKVSEGDPIQLSAGLQNATIDMLREHAKTKAGQVKGGDCGDTRSHALIMSTKWTGSSVSTLDPFSVLKIGAAVLDPATYPYDATRRPVFEGDTVTDAAAPFIITAEPIIGQTIGRAVVSGMAVVKVNVTDAAHAYATPIVGDTAKLVSGATGAVPIVFKESGTGVKWAVVLLPAAGAAASSDPDASVSVRGYVSTGTQSFAGVKTFASIPLAGAWGFTGSSATLTLYTSGGITDIGAQGVSDFYVQGTFVYGNYQVRRASPASTLTGVTDTFATGDGRTATVTGGIITDIS